MVTLPWKEPGGRPETASLMFTTPAGQVINRHQWNDGHWKPALKAAGIPIPVTEGGKEVTRDLGFHMLRHTFISGLFARGVNPVAVASYVGHHDPGFTMRVYGWLMPDTDDQARQAIDAALSGDVAATAREAVNR